MNPMPIELNLSEAEPLDVVIALEIIVDEGHMSRRKLQPIINRVWRAIENRGRVTAENTNT